RGIYISDSGATGNLIQGNFIGTDVNGTSPLRNDNAGVFISQASSNTVGGTTGLARNIISGNIFGSAQPGVGVDIFGDMATANLIQGNFIGTNANGTAAINHGSPSITGNGHGVMIDGASGNTVGGAIPGARNIISGNSGDGGVDGHGI